MSPVGWLIIATCLGYLNSTVFYMAYLLRFREVALRFGRATMIGAWLLHGCALIARFVLGAGGAEGLPTDLLLVASFIAVGAYIVTSLKRPGNMGGAFLTPVVTVVLYSVWEGARQAGTVRDQVIGLVTPLHIGASIIGVLAFTVAFVVSILYLVQDHNLKKHKLLVSSRGRIPPLGSLERANHRAILIGFPVYTVGIVLGAVWVGKMAHHGIPPQYVLAIAAWVIYGLLLYSRLTIGWKGRRAAVLTIIGFLSSLSVVLIYMSRTMA
ncbi:MAG: c-type cytochrome biogenesis protein CcsB [Myxococcales bacterium]